MSDDPRFGLSRIATLPGPLRLDGGVLLSPVDIAYETYGALAPDAGNAILICHALTGDQHVAAAHPVTGKPGWWTRMVGPGKPIDTGASFRHLRQRARRLHGLDRPGQHRSRDRRALGDALPGHHHPRHGARAGDAARSSRHRAAARGGRRLDGRDAGAELGRELPRARARGRGDRHPPRGIRRRTSPSTRSAARRSWPIPNWRGGDYYGTAIRPQRASRWRGWRRTSPICPRPG